MSRPASINAPVSPMPAPPVQAAPPSFALGEFSWIWVALALLVVASALVAPGTLRLSSLTAMLPFAAMLALSAVSQTLVIQQRGLDLSAGAFISLGGIVLAKLSALSGLPFPSAIATLTICGALGVVNGVLIARVGISPIVATLASGATFAGLARLMSKGSALPIPESLQSVLHLTVLGAPINVLLSAVLILGTALLIRKTVTGRRFVAMGVNKATALASGVVVLRYQIGTYALAAALNALAGMLLSSYVGYASSTAGDDYLLPAIAAVVVGGTPFTGGRGSVIASGLAALFMSQLGQMVLALGAGPAQQLLVQAFAIVVATSIRRLPVAALRARLVGRQPVATTP